MGHERKVALLNILKCVVRDSNYISFIGHIWIQLILIHNPY